MEVDGSKQAASLGLPVMGCQPRFVWHTSIPRLHVPGLGLVAEQFWRRSPVTRQRPGHTCYMERLHPVSCRVAPVKGCRDSCFNAVHVTLLHALQCVTPASQVHASHFVSLS